MPTRDRKEAIDRLIDLYTATNNPDEVKTWRAERAKCSDIAPMPRAVVKYPTPPRRTANADS